MERPIIPQVPDKKYPDDATKEKPIKLPDTEPGKDNPKNPKEDVI